MFSTVITVILCFVLHVVVVSSRNLQIAPTESAGNICFFVAFKRDFIVIGDVCLRPFGLPNRYTAGYLLGSII